MCGIAGIVGDGIERRQIDAMVAAQHHRGPDDSGTVMFKDPGIALGHNRLSIIDLSAAGHQPMADSEQRRWIVFNGEIYNYKELRSELSEYPYRSRSDTEVILAAYARWGTRCVERFIGMFAFALWDAPSKTLFCSRDRLGIKPFHYAQHAGRFMFASEIKALAAAGVPLTPDLNSWAVYLAHGFSDHADATFFENIHSLAPGHNLIYQNGELSISSYWDLPAIAAAELRLSDRAAGSRLLELLEDSVRLRLRSDVPVGVNLSGGLDSAGLFAVVDQFEDHGGGVQSFTAVFNDPRYDEAEFADQVPRRRNWVRNLQPLTPERVPELACEAVAHQEAPYGGISTLAYHNLHRSARDNGVTVLLEGQGVDELLAGYAYFRPPYHNDLLEYGNCQRLRGELRADPSGKTAALLGLRRERGRHENVVYQDGTAHLRNECIAPEIRERAGAAPAFPRPFTDHLRNALWRDLRYTKLPRVLRMNDRLSMAFSRELREPYLDHRIVEFAFRLPGGQKIRDGQGKYLLRSAMQGRLPDAVRRTAKRPVVTPQREWLRRELRPWVESIINDASFRQRGLFDVPMVRRTYRDFCDGAGENAFFIWQWINTELWYRVFCDNHRQPLALAAGPELGRSAT